ncbi:MAG TPA: Smr/MutS family protein [Bryobacteraceae bacterium]|nr:Smr/MutS family protein [Bryobacteraceae bacterium]
MRETSADILEFESLRELLGRYISSQLGRRELERLQPISDRAVLERLLAETAEAIEYVRAAARPQPASREAAIRVRFTSIPDVAEAAGKLRIEGAALEPREIYDLLRFLDQAGEARSVITAVGERFPLLNARAANIADFNAVIRDLGGKVLADGSVADDASVALYRLRRDIDRQQREIQASLERFLRAHREEGTLQEEFVTIRNERFVVPIVAGQRRKVDGVIHAASASGHTLFVEPMETIDLNNDLVRLREEEAAEVHRILLELTERLRQHAEAINRAMQAMGELEVVFAKANFAREFDCVIPRFSPELDRRLHLKDARHPLLEDVLRRQNKAVVPISVTLDERCRTLLISGPNTGGKTVAMKTVGLLALMAQAALPTPAAEAEFPIFEQVLADIGDQQSIAESLSTFSAHILAIRRMLEKVTTDALVLLDELGRATDPEEGGALGVAILEAFRSSGAFTLASTHLLALKAYGASTESVVNAAMGFDEKTLAPTYILRTGAPGKSAGLDIASRLGIEPQIIERARAAMSASERDLQRFLGELQERLDRVSELEASLRQQQDRLAERERALEKDWERKGSAKLRELEERSLKLAREFEENARRTLDEIARGLEQRKAAENAMRRVAKTRREFLEQSSALSQASQTGAEAAPALAAIQEGARIRLKGVRQPARVRRRIGDDMLEVEAGFMKMQVSIDDVEEVLPPGGGEARRPSGVNYQQAGPRWNASYREINVIGKRADEAAEEVDKFLDSAALAQVDRIRIVHGFGTGVLRRTISDLLARNPHVEKFYPAAASEGGAGATVVELKQ